MRHKLEKSQFADDEFGEILDINMIELMKKLFD